MAQFRLLDVLRRSGAGALLLALLAGASCAPARRDGAKVEMPRMVSLNPCTDATLVELADPVQILAISRMSHDPQSSSISPQSARRFAAVSGTLEEVVALDPDLVLAGSYLSPATRAALNDLKYRTETFDIAHDISESHGQVRSLARLAGQQARGTALIARIDRALAHHAAPPGRRPISAVLWQPGEIVAGKSSLVSEVLRRMGFVSHSEALGMGQGDYLPLEVLLADPPELLLIAGDARAQHHPALEKLAASGQTRIERIDPALLYCGGPTIIRLSARLAAIREVMQ